MPATTETPPTVTHEIRHRLTGKVLFAVEVGASLPPDHRARIAVQMAIKAGFSLESANLAGANMRGVNMRGANLESANLESADMTGADMTGAEIRGAKIIKLFARVTRSDGHEALAFNTDKGVVIRAGCQTWFGTNAGLAHVATYATRQDRSPAISTETLAILDFIDDRAKQEGL